MKLDYTLVYDNSSAKFDTGHSLIKVKVTVINLSPFNAIQTFRSNNTFLVPASKLILSMHIHLIIMYKI